MTLLTVGCTSLRQYVHNGLKVGPQYGRPPAPVAEDWIEGNDVRVSRDPDTGADWWAVFDDPVLSELVATASQQNITVREAGYRVLQARASRAIAIGGLFPQQQLAAAEYQRIARSGVSLARGITLPDRFFNEWNGGFSLAWELDFWGRFRRAVEAADAELDASIEDYDDVLVTLVADVATTYVEIRTIQEQLRLVHQNIALQQETFNIADARFKGGIVNELDVDQAGGNLGETKALVPELEISLRQANNRLCVLLGIPPEELVERIGARPIPTAPKEVAVGIPAELLAQRPDVRRVERRVAAQSAEIGIAESDLYPQISITGNIGVSSTRLTNLFRKQAFTGSVGPAVEWNILNYGRLINNVRRQNARFQELVARYQNTVLRANAEVENALVEFLESQDRTAELAESVAFSEKAARVVLAQYHGGMVNFNRVSLVEQNLVQRQNDLAQARGEIAVGLIEVYRALGGGWQVRLDPPQHAEIVPGGPPIEMLPMPEPVPAMPELPELTVLPKPSDVQMIPTFDKAVRLATPQGDLSTQPLSTEGVQQAAFTLLPGDDRRDVPCPPCEECCDDFCRKPWSVHLPSHRPWYKCLVFGHRCTCADHSLGRQSDPRVIENLENTQLLMPNRLDRAE